METEHDLYLEKLCNNFKYIGLDNKKVEWVLKEGIWLKENSYDKFSLCDLIIAYYDNKTFPVELKRKYNRKSKALKQIEQGNKFIEQVLNRETTYGIFVTYYPNKFNYEKIYKKR